MRGVRGWTLLGGLALIAVAAWQIVLYSTNPETAADWLRFIQAETMLGKTWGARVVALLLLIAPLRFFAERAEGGWGVAGRGFLTTWFALAFIGALLQTQSVERLRELAANPEAAEPIFRMWHALVEPVTRTASVLGVFGISFLIASIGRRAAAFGIALLVIQMIPAAWFWSSMMEGILTAVFGFLLIGVAFTFPREYEGPRFL